MDNKRPDGGELAARLDRLIGTFEGIPEALVRILAAYGIVHIGQLASMTEAGLIGRTACFGGLPGKEASDAMFSLTCALVDAGFGWGMDVNSLYGWQAPAVRKASGAQA